MDLFHTIQKNVFDYCDKINDEDFFMIVDSMLFENSTNLTLKHFLVKMECYDDYLVHLTDLEVQPYFLKCSGSRLNYIEDVKKALLVSSYNRLKRKCKN